MIKYFFCFFLLVFSLPLLATSYNYEVLIERIQKDLHQLEGEDITTLDRWVKEMNDSGKWEAFSYGKLPFETLNVKDNHLRRLLFLTHAASNTAHERHLDSNYIKTVRKGLDYWLKSNTTDGNWWWNQIYFPQRLGEILILSKKFPEPIEPALYLSLFAPQSIEKLDSYGKGANMLDFALHYVYRGILTKDAQLLDATSDFLAKEMLANLQMDQSFQDHGAQLMIASYGSEFSQSIVQIAKYLEGTPSAFSAEQFEPVLQFVRNTQLTSIRGDNWDYSVVGRGVSRKGYTKIIEDFLLQLETLRDYLDKAHAEVYDAALKRIRGEEAPSYQISPKNRYYWKSDYVAHSQPNYLYTVRKVSRRTVESETGNKESLKSHYLSYGANFVSVNGNEYEGIMPLWDWAMIPGVTSQHTFVFPERKKWGSNPGATDFVGGVSNGKVGVAVLEMDKNGTTAQKSWFFFPEEVVCLGSGIQDASANEIRTTLNQAWLDGELRFFNNNKEVKGLKKANGLWHDSIAYHFPYKQAVALSVQEESGSWHTINGGESTESIKAPVFKLWINHGLHPKKEDYAYIIVPGMPNPSQLKDYPFSQIKILENTQEKQVVWHQGQQLVCFVFWKAGVFSHRGRQIVVDRPCLVFLDENNKEMYISDPTQKESSLEIAVDWGSLQLDKRKVMLPSGELAGSSVQLLL